jgi:hypothetical protein
VLLLLCRMLYAVCVDVVLCAACAAAVLLLCCCCAACAHAAVPYAVLLVLLVPYAVLLVPYAVLLVLLCRMLCNLCRVLYAVCCCAMLWACAMCRVGYTTHPDIDLRPVALRAQQQLRRHITLRNDVVALARGWELRPALLLHNPLPASAEAL